MKRRTLLAIMGIRAPRANRWTATFAAKAVIGLG